MQLLYIFYLGQGAQFFYQFLMAYQSVYQAVLQEILREVQGQVVNQAVQFVYRNLTGGRHLPDKGRPDGIHQLLVLLPVLGGRGVADEHLTGALVFAVTDELDVNAQFVQDIL